MWNICGRISGVCCCFGGFLEHLREFFLRKMLLFWWFFGTFAGKSPAFVVVLVVLWNICGKISGVCATTCLRVSVARAKATRSGNSLRLEVRGTSNASFVASASQSARAFRCFFGTFAGKSPAFVVVLAFLWNICRKISGVCADDMLKALRCICVAFILWNLIKLCLRADTC